MSWTETRCRAAEFDSAVGAISMSPEPLPLVELSPLMSTVCVFTSTLPAVDNSTISEMFKLVALTVSLNVSCSTSAVRLREKLTRTGLMVSGVNPPGIASTRSICTTGLLTPTLSMSLMVCEVIARLVVDGDTTSPGSLLISFRSPMFRCSVIESWNKGPQ